MMELAVCMFEGQHESERVAVAHDADHCTVGVRSRLTVSHDIAQHRMALFMTHAQASGHQASSHNCGPVTRNCGPDPQNLALGASECHIPVQFSVEHRGFEPRTPCLPAKWSRFQRLRHRPFPSQGEQRFSTQSATSRRFFSG